MHVLPDGAILASGETSGGSPFVVRFLGPSDGDGPGMIGVKYPDVFAMEQDQRAIATVRRIGGRSGSVSVGFRTYLCDIADTGSATAGEDYTPASGRLAWDDGDMAEQQIIVQIAHDGTSEQNEGFCVDLDDVQGGAVVNAGLATVKILADESAFGQFTLELTTPTVRESNSAQLLIHRNLSALGAVSVTLTPKAGTAAADEDFAAGSITLSWASGDSTPISVAIPIRADNQHEDMETFSVELSNPTDGATLGEPSVATITIAADVSNGDDRGGGGGGAMSYFSLLGLAAIRALRLASCRALFGHDALAPVLETRIAFERCECRVSIDGIDIEIRCRIQIQCPE